MKFEWTMPIRTVSESNASGEHWSKKSKRHKQQQFFTKAYFNENVKEKLELPCKITITRIAPRKLDKDENLPMASKWIKDQLADCITPGLAKGRADDNELITWVFAQEKGEPKEYAVKIQIE